MHGLLLIPFCYSIYNNDGIYKLHLKLEEKNKIEPKLHLKLEKERLKRTPFPLNKTLHDYMTVTW